MSEKPKVLTDEEKYRLFAEQLVNSPPPGLLGDGGFFTYFTYFLACLSAGGIVFFIATNGFRLG